MRTFILLISASFFTIGLSAQQSKSFWRQAAMSAWGGYTVYTYSKDLDNLKNTCDTVKNDTGKTEIDCNTKVKGFAGGLDLWAGNFAQFGVGVQFLQLLNIKYDYTDSVTTGLPPTTKDVKTEFKLTAQYIPVLAQFRVNPKYFFVAIGVGAAFPLATAELTVGDKTQNSVKDDLGTGLIVQASAGLSVPLGGVSIEAGCKGTMITNYYESSKDSAGNTTYDSTSGYFVTPYAAVTLNF